jgi:hypothetical protein
LGLVPLRVASLGDRDGAVPQRLADFADVHPAFQEFYAERVAQHVRCLVNSRGLEDLTVHPVKGAYRSRWAWPRR